MRRGKIIWLRWERIDLDTKILLLPKNKNTSSRWVLLSDGADAKQSKAPGDTGPDPSLSPTWPWGFDRAYRARFSISFRLDCKRGLQNAKVCRILFAHGAVNTVTSLSLKPTTTKAAFHLTYPEKSYQLRCNYDRLTQSLPHEILIFSYMKPNKLKCLKSVCYLF